jgi:hypothetical protein
MYNIGDLVRYIGNECSDGRGELATIRAINDGTNYGYFGSIFSEYDYIIEFENEDIGHSCRNFFENDCGLFARESDLEDPDEYYEDEDDWDEEDEEDEENNENREGGNIEMFRVGQRVKAIKACDNASRFIGKEGVVMGIGNYSRTPICVHFDNGENWNCEPDSLEIIAEPSVEYKVGDEVVFIGGRGSRYGKRARICNLTDVPSEYFCGIEFETAIGAHSCGNTCRYGYGYWVRYDEIELIERSDEKVTKSTINKIKNKVIISFTNDLCSMDYQIIKLANKEKVCENNTERFADIIADKYVLMHKDSRRIINGVNPHIEDELVEENCSNWRVDGDCYEVVKRIFSGLDSIILDLDTGKFYDYIPKDYTKCKGCGKLVKKTQIMGDRCENCITQEGNLAYRYSYHSFRDKYKLLDKGNVDTRKTLTFGCEIERDYLNGYSDSFNIDLKNALVGAVRALYTKKELENSKSNRKAVFMTDGSLTNDGIEYITFPATYKWYKQNATKIQNVLDVMKQFNFGNSNKCGNHIHFNRTFFGEEHKFASAKIALLLNSYWDEFIKIAKRATTSYCSKPSQTKEDSLFSIVEKTVSSQCEHSVAINLEHKDTIECRIWGGIDSVDDLLLYMDITQSLAKFAKKSSLGKCQCAKFEDLFKYLTDKDKHIPMIVERLGTRSPHKKALNTMVGGEE